MTLSASLFMSRASAKILCLSCAMLLSFPALTLANSCPIEAGQAIPADSARTVFNRLAQKNMTKGEFETTAQYEARISTMERQSSGPIFVHMPYDPNDTEYDADREILRLWVYAFDNEGPSWQNALRPKGTLSMPTYSRRFQRPGRSSMIEFGVGLGTEDTLTGQYDASNAYGASVTVSEIDRQVYSVYQGEISHSDKWRLDGRGIFQSSLGPLPDTGYIELPVSIAQAREIKDNLQIVLAFTPISPFTATGSKRWDPKINQPQEIHATYNVILGQSHCLRVLDRNGKALHTILPTSEPKAEPKAKPNGKKGEWI